ncbi:hypothetical protein L218DRAFT_1004911 [Marasmius fiardii PR-910]|nr:hypothetical protein L218DRAFT_1004911 [Marasmius fiardii PR-910]
MPSLSTFELACVSTSKTTQVWPPLLFDMLKQSTTLRSLSLSLGTGRQKRFSWEPLSALLNAIPHITHLQLSGTVRFPRICWDSFISPSLFEMANVSGNGTAILPHLTHLSVTNIGKVTPDVVNTVVTLAIARSPMRFSQSAIGDSSGVQPLESRVEDWESSEIDLEPEAVEAVLVVREIVPSATLKYVPCRGSGHYGLVEPRLS